MALVWRTCDLIRSCLAWQNNNNDDTQQIVNDRVPPIDGIDIPDSGVISNMPTSVNFVDMNNPIVKMFVESLEVLKQENEENKKRYEEDKKRLEDELAATSARCDKYQSQIVSLLEGQKYVEEQRWRRHDVTYSPTYLTEEQEDEQARRQFCT